MRKVYHTNKSRFDVLRKGRAMALLLFFFLNVNVFAQTNVVNHSIVFETDTLQSMWGSGTGFQINRNIDLFPRFESSFGFDTRPGSIFSFGGLKFGAGIYGGYKMGIGPLRFRISGFEGGSVGVTYPITTELVMPADSTFNAGELITINTDYVVDAGYEIETNYPESGEIALEMPMLFDVRAGIDFCIFGCFNYSLFPPFPANLVAPDPLFDDTLVILAVNKDEYTYPCMPSPPDFMPFCTEEIPYGSLPSLPASSPLQGTLKIPYVETTTSLSGKDLVAEGADPYLVPSLDIIHVLSYAPGVGPYFALLSSGIQLPPGGIPDFGGTRRYIDVSWTLFTMNLEFPISQSQRFVFHPTVYTSLVFPTKVEYQVTDPVAGTSFSGEYDTIRVPLGADLTLRYPCDYAHMDVSASYTIENDFSNKTYDHIDVQLVFAALEFGVTFPDFDIIPRFCISIPFIGSFCIQLTLPGFTIGFGPLINPPPVHLAGFDFPPYYDDSWHLEGFSEIPIEEPFRIIPNKFRIETLSAGSALCNGEASGSANINVSGATTPLAYTWSTGVTTQNISNVRAGKHYVQVVDANGCRANSFVDIVEPPVITSVVSGADLICNADNSGTASVNVSGGTPGYNYMWLTTGDNSASTNSLPAGKHIVQITDNNGCIKIDSIQLTEPRAIKSSILKAVVPTCSGYSNGKIEIDVSGGSEPYSYSWSNGSVSRDILGITSGNYTVTITDDHGCISVASTTLIDPDPIDILLTPVRHVSCYGGRDGEILGTVTGGTTPYTYRWLNNSVTLSESGNRVQRLSAGTYALEITDKNGCASANTLTLTQPTARLESTLTITAVSCNRGEDGEITANVTGGTAPYSALWSNGATGLTATSLEAGKYDVTITDANGCTTTNKGVLIQPSKISLVIKTEDVSCSLQQDGKIRVNSYGGTPPYTYFWSNSSVDSVLTNLSDGTYSVTVTDSKGCNESGIAVVSKIEGECLFIPSAFSPNGDGKNDTWVIRNIHLYPNNNFKVFNRWGQEVFSSAPYKEWDGTYNGNLLPSATYYYIIDIGDGRDPITGPITILK